MPLKPKSMYRKAARLYFKGMPMDRACFKAGIYKDMEIANKNAYSLFKPETGNEAILEELEKLKAVEFNELVLSKKEKLEASARISRGIQEKLEEQIESEDGEIDHKLLESWVKVGKRDDVLQGHQIQAETNPQDKRDSMIMEWFMEAQRQNEENRGMKQADAVDV